MKTSPAKQSNSDAIFESLNKRSQKWFHNVLMILIECQGYSQDGVKWSKVKRSLRNVNLPFWFGFYISFGISALSFSVMVSYIRHNDQAQNEMSNLMRNWWIRLFFNYLAEKFRPQSSSSSHEFREGVSTTFRISSRAPSSYSPMPV